MECNRKLPKPGDKLPNTRYPGIKGNTEETYYSVHEPFVGVYNI